MRFLTIVMIIVIIINGLAMVYYTFHEKYDRATLHTMWFFGLLLLLQRA